MKYFLDSYNENKKLIYATESNIERENDLRFQADQAANRREYYTAYSLPNNLNKSKTEYGRYLEQLAQEECGLDITSVRPKSGKNTVDYMGSNGRTKVFDQVTYTLRGSGTLDQVTDFLHKFYSLNMIQRISSLSITPQNVGGSGDKEFLRNSFHTVEMTLDVISMVGSEDEREFKNEFHELKKSLDGYNASILRRNMFGPANNAPRLTTTTKTLTESEADVSFKISGTDPDKNDNLKFELMTTEIAGAQLIQAKDTDKSAQFTCPPLDPGVYTFNVLVSDSGYPSKSLEQEVKLTIREKRVYVKKEDPKPEPAKFATSTFIRSTAVDVDGTKIFVHVAPTNDSFWVKVGDSFKLDEKEWNVQSVVNRKVRIECEGELLTYDIMGSNNILGKPESRETIEP